ncbi:MAG: hypothetical protein ACYC1D_05265 [Acidimicrobiales bacterium]
MAGADRGHPGHRDDVGNGGAGGAAEDVIAAFVRWATREHAAEAAGARSTERWLRQEDAEAATWTGLLVDLAERRQDVVLSVAGGDHDAPARLTGTLVGTGRDFAVVEDHARVTTLVRTAAIVTLAGGPTNGPRPVAAGDREPAIPLDFAGALAALGAQRCPVLLRVAGGGNLSGDVVSVGVDVLTLQHPPPRRSTLHVALGRIWACTPT